MIIDDPPDWDAPDEDAPDPSELEEEEPTRPGYCRRCGNEIANPDDDEPPDPDQTYCDYCIHILEKDD